MSNYFLLLEECAVKYNLTGKTPSDNMQGMKAKKLIDVLGGPQAVANILNEAGLKVHTRQRIWNWHKTDKIPAWAQIEYPRVWAKAERMVARITKL